MRRAFLVYNPMAGRFPSWLLAEKATALLRSLGWEIQLAQTESGEQITQLARQAAEAGMEAFFVVGGDGSLNRAVAGLAGSSTALAVLPAGTANVWSQELGLPGLTWTRWDALEASARQLSQAPARKVDVGLCNGTPFLLWAGVGLDAFVVHRLEPRTRLEKYLAVVHYTASAVWSATQWHGLYLQVEADERRLEGHYLLALVSNVHLYAGGLAELSPDSRLDDGRLEMWLFKGETMGDTVQRVLDLLSGKHLHSDQVESFSFQSLTLKSIAPTYVQVDGEPLDSRMGVEIQVLPQALWALVPDTTPLPLFSRIKDKR